MDLVVDGGGRVADCGAVQLRGNHRLHVIAKKGNHNGL